jgi:prepilin-type N-terminal cleavage/methylation domain-containing protein
MRKTGFTLIELVMVIVIIGILAAVAVPRFMDLRAEAERARCQADIGAIRTGVSGWYARFHVNTSATPCPSGNETDCVPAPSAGRGFPTLVTMDDDTGGFARFAFAEQRMPLRSDKISNRTNGWGTGSAYDQDTGSLNMTAACGN